MFQSAGYFHVVYFIPLIQLYRDIPLFVRFFVTTELREARENRYQMKKKKNTTTQKDFEISPVERRK